MKCKWNHQWDAFLVPTDWCIFKSLTIPSVQWKVNLSTHPVGGNIYCYKHFGNKLALCGQVEDMQNFQPCDWPPEYKPFRVSCTYAPGDMHKKVLNHTVCNTKKAGYNPCVH